jgi:cobalt-zinc-cadmium efflux system membrane fusion protein
MTTTRWVLGVAVLALLLAASAFFLKRPDTSEADATSAPASTNGIVPFRMEQQWLIRLKLAIAEQTELPSQIYSTGRVIASPANRAVVAPPVAGILENRSLPRIGQRVRRGQVLASLVQVPTAAETAQIHIENSRIDAERRRLAQLEIEIRARLSAASAEAERARRLFEKKAYSQRQLEIADADRQAAEANLIAVQQQIKALQPAPLQAIYDVVAPLSGTVVDVKKAAGEEVRSGEVILEIVSLDTLWVEAPIFEKDLGRLTKDINAAFSTAAFPDEEFRGRLVDIGAVVDEQTRTAKAVFEVNNTAGKLRLGMQANLRLGAGDKRTVLLVPKEAVLDNEGKKIVYVLRSGEEFERRDVVVGDEYGDKVAIISGVKPAERVVTQGAYQLKLQELRPANAGAHTHEV